MIPSGTNSPPNVVLTQCIYYAFRQYLSFLLNAFLVTVLLMYVLNMISCIYKIHVVEDSAWVLRSRRSKKDRQHKDKKSSKGKRCYIVFFFFFFFFCICTLVSDTSIMRVTVGIPLTGLTQPRHIFCACPKPG